MRLRRKINDLSIQKKLMLVFFVTTILVLAVNLFMYIDINAMMRRLDQIYVSNINLNSLSDMLDNVQNDMDNYLNTKTTDSMDAYYKSYQEYSSNLENLSDQITGNEVQRMERNIRNMSEEYLGYTELAIEAKRGRNVEKYRYYNEEATTIYNYLKAYIGSLNMSQFKYNSTNYAALSQALRYVEVVNMIVFVFVAFANVFLVLMVVRDITRPLTSLSEVANEVAAGNLNVGMLAVTSKDEIGVVSSAFNQMVVSIRNYIGRLRTSMDNERALKEKELKMETHLKDAQLKYLQAQINPHFLFNTLNAGAQLAMMEDADRTYEYVQNVAQFFRYNIKKNHDTVALREELELIDTYIYILNVRFSGEIHYEKDIDESLTELVIPSMILQPVIENSVNYGIRGIPWEGIIRVELYEKDDHKTAYLVIEDNGVGITEEAIAKIMSDQEFENDMREDSNGIGLQNVISRLRLFYDTNDIFEISSLGENKGTRVVISIPLSKKEEEVHV